MASAQSNSEADPIQDTRSLLPVTLDLGTSVAKFIDGKWIVSGEGKVTSAVDSDQISVLMQRIRVLEQQGQQYERRLKGKSIEKSLQILRSRLAQYFYQSKFSAHGFALCATRPPSSAELSDSNAMLAFKHKLMLEMLAVSQLDGETAARMLRDERLRSEALKWELARSALADARTMAE